MSHENLLVSSILNGTILLVLLCWSIINIVVFSSIPKVNCLNSRFRPLHGNIKIFRKTSFSIHSSHDISHIFFIPVHIAQSNSVCAKPLKQNSFIFAMGFTKRIIQSIDRLVSMYLFFFFFLFALFIGNDWVAGFRILELKLKPQLKYNWIYLSICHCCDLFGHWLLPPMPINCKCHCKLGRMFFLLSSLQFVLMMVLCVEQIRFYQLLKITIHFRYHHLNHLELSVWLLYGSEVLPVSHFFFLFVFASTILSIYLLLRIRIEIFTAFVGQ